jgi:Bacterial regulatory protein, arsR family/HNH endonuclease
LPLDDPANAASTIPLRPASKRRDGRRTLTRIKVRVLHEQGCTGAEIADILGVSKPTVCYHLRNLGVPVQSELGRRFAWDAIAAHYEAGHSMRECQVRFGFSRAAWYQAAERGDIRPRERRQPLAEILHHVNGEGRDNRIENLRFLCPNCHSQTDNFSGRKNRVRGA